jgi:hypothetical protein
VLIAPSPIAQSPAIQWISASTTDDISAQIQIVVSHWCM